MCGDNVRIASFLQQSGTLHGQRIGYWILQTDSLAFVQIHPNALHKIAFDLPPGSVVALGGAGRGVADEIGHVVNVVALFEQVGHDHDPEGVGRVETAVLRVFVPVRGRFRFPRAEPRIDEPPLEHASHVAVFHHPACL